MTILVTMISCIVTFTPDPLETIKITFCFGEEFSFGFSANEKTQVLCSTEACWLLTNYPKQFVTGLFPQRLKNLARGYKRKHWHLENKSLHLRYESHKFSNLTLFLYLVSIPFGIFLFYVSLLMKTIQTDTYLVYGECSCG